MIPRIEIISFWYNEAFLAPFFLGHYGQIGEMTIVIDGDTDDGTERLISQCPSAGYRYHFFPDGMDTQEKQNVLNQMYRWSKADWVIMVDADEFVCLDGLADELKTASYALKNVMFYQVYRHVTEVDLNPLGPAYSQRRHGDPNTHTGINVLYRKPVICRTGLPITWIPGCHAITGPKNLTWCIQNDTVGSHWALADPCMIERRLSRSKRRSRINRENGMSWHWEGLDKQKLLAECEAHSNDPEVL